MVDILQIVSAIAGFGPSLFLLYFTMRDYTYPRVKQPFFDDSKIFKFFALGIVLGMVIFALEQLGGSSSTETVILVVTLFAIFEEAMKLVILNYPKFQRKVDTAFCGLSMGLGIAMTFTFASVYSTLLSITNPGPTEIIGYSLIGLQFVFLHGSTTTLIGIGVARGDVRGYFVEALLVHIGYSLLMVLFFEFASILPLSVFGIAAASALVVYEYVKIHKTSLPVLIQDAKKLMASTPAKTKRA